jgi:hypothetical protein
MSRNKFKFRRQIIAAGGIDSTAGCEFDAASTFNGAVTFAALDTFNAGIAETVQSLTAADCERTGTTGTRILGYGITKASLTKADATGAANFQLVLAGPVAAGVHKTLVLTRATGASTFEVWISNLTSALTFYGTTADGIKLTTDWKSPNPAAFQFVGITTAQWAALTVNGLQSSQWSYTGTTFSAT